MKSVFSLFAILLLTTGGVNAHDTSRKGSEKILEHAHRIVVKEQGHKRLRTPYDVAKAVHDGRLVLIQESTYLKIDQWVTYPYALPEVKGFLDRLSKQHFEASGCGEKLAVTSLARPEILQPEDSSKEWSLHPSGAAVDFRDFDHWKEHPECRRWLHAKLSDLEARAVLDFYPESDHFHVSLFPAQYADYVRELEESEVATLE